MNVNREPASELSLLDPDDKALKVGLDQIYELSFTGIAGHFAALLIWIVIIRELLPFNTVLLLSCLQVLVLLIRTFIATQYKKKNHLIVDSKDLKRWIALFALGASLTGLSWSVWFFAITALDMEYHFIFYTLLVSLTAAGITTLGGVSYVYLAFMLSLMVVSAIWLFLHGGFLYNITAVWCIYFMVFAFTTVRRYSDNIRIAITEKEIANEKNKSLQLVTEELKANSERFERWKESNFIGIIQIKSSGEIISANNTILKMLGYTTQDLENKSLTMASLTPLEFTQLDNNAIKQALEKGYWTPYQKEYFHKDGSRIPVLLGGSIFHKDNREFIIFVVDLTERKQQEEQIRRSQKMDALGKLTGGIAHDYNNMLGVILGYSELLQTALKDQPKLANYATQIQTAGKRGANLTNKILSFTSNESGSEDVVNINALLQEQQQMIEKTLTVRIKLIFELSSDLYTVFVNQHDLEDVILNICINAMHAMEDNDSDPQLAICTVNKKITSVEAMALDLTPGNYVQLSFMDTGCGMEQNAIEKVFDPFYSTKGSKGTGLGLSQVFGFVKRAKGTVKVYSELKRGSQFVLYFPQYIESDSKPEDQTSEDNSDFTGTEKILLVDDEKALLDLASEILKQQGYQTFLAQGAEQALQILETETVDLMVSDIIMPDMDGYQLSAIVHEKYPEIKIQLASGYAGEQYPNTIDESLQNNLISKPYQGESLLKHVRDLLDNS
ncbi:MAG: hypothetical protein DRQ47_02190 [Gammaproteobacteria bacterium]|nr:MAG: hypothetical protein DRQ47_02190 [Gammaproteobacteria bacterium]